MNSNSIGTNLVLTIFGESHGTGIGAVLEGCPAGLELKESDVQKEVEKRRPGLTMISTPRFEEDRVKIVSGVFKGRTTGSPICMMVRNEDIESKHYEQVARKPRPGHADYVAFIKYGGYNDYRGGGMFSGRVTVAYVMAGAVAKKILGLINVEILAHTIQIGKVKVPTDLSYEKIRENVYNNPVRSAVPGIAKLMEKSILEAAEEGDSLGGKIEGVALNVPVGLGEPIFHSLDSDLAKMIFNIPGVKAVGFGKGFSSPNFKGSEWNDEYAIKDGKVITLTNNVGGILGGMSTGMPIIVRVAFKPTSSISKKQKTIDLRLMKETEIELVGRHDPCIVPRAVPIVESCLAYVLADHAITANKIPRIISEH